MTHDLSGMPEGLLAVGSAAARPSAPATSFFEFWPGWLFYLPVVVQWIGLGLRHGDFSLPTAANPRITGGGLCGESKAMILDQVTGDARQLIAPYERVAAGTDDAEAAAARIGYPLVAKPDIGCNGTGVRLIPDAAALSRYIAAFPPRAGLLLQALAPEPGEAGIFYMRHPDEPHGRITSITLKSPPTVIGDGRSSLRSLILADRRLRRMAKLFFPRLADRLDGVPDSGAPVQLAFVGNHCKGSLFEDGRAHATRELNTCIEQLARSIPEFHFGRFDLRFRSLAELRRGMGFTIIEINGAGSEATHIWDPRTSLWHAYATQFAHYRAAFAIGRRNRARGFPSTGLRELFGLLRHQRRLMAAYPTHD